MPGGRPTPLNDPAFARDLVRSRRAELVSSYQGRRKESSFRCLEPTADGGVCGTVFDRQWGVALRDEVIRCRPCISSRMRAHMVADRRPKDLPNRVRAKGGEILPGPYVNAHTPISVRCLAVLPSGSECGMVFTRTPHSLRAGKTAFCLSCVNRHIGERAREHGRVGYTLDYVQQFFSDRSARLLTLSYANVNQKLDYVCGEPGCAQAGQATMQALLLSRPDIGDVIQCKACQDASRPRGSASKQYNPNLSDEDRADNAYLRGKPCAIWARLVRALHGQACLIRPLEQGKEVHHVLSWAHNPAERFLVTNGVPLSATMHGEYHLNWAPNRRGKADLATFRAFVRHHTGQDYVPLLPGLAPEIIQPCLDEAPSALLSRKIRYAAEGLLYIPIFPGEAENRRSIVISMLLNRAKQTRNAIGARQLDLVRVRSPEARTFFADNHVQGYAPSSECYGLLRDGVLLSAMLFTPLRVPAQRVQEKGWELVRMAHKVGWSVPGAASRLLHAFRQEHPSASITTYADRRFCAADPGATVYPKLGFNYTHTSKPSYRYTNREGTVLLNKKGFQRRYLPGRLGDKFDPGKSEAGNMRDAGYYRLWDCGTFVFHLSP